MWLCSCFRYQAGSKKAIADSIRPVLCCLKNTEKEMKIDASILSSATKIWNYMLLHHTLKKSDVILVLGNEDMRTAKYAAHLYKKGLADWLMFSGKVGASTQGKWDRPEAEVFCDVAVKEGVPRKRIILEKCATNTGENIKFSNKLLKSLGIEPKKVILVQKPYMERRVYATFMKQYPEARLLDDVMVTSFDVKFEEYPNKEIGTLDDVIGMMLGCMERIKVYPKRGFHIHQDIPEDVWDAFEYLKQTSRYNSHLMSKHH